MSISPDKCTSCGIPSTRREFVRNLTLGLAAAFAAAGVSPSAAAAATVDVVQSLPDTSLPTYPIPTVDGAQIDKKNEVILVRWEGAVYGFNLSCPHQNTALRWNASDHRFKCPKHNSRYEPDGHFIDGRATRGMDRFSLAIAGPNVVVDVNAMHKQDADPAAWAAAMVKIPN